MIVSFFYFARRERLLLSQTGEFETSQAWIQMLIPSSLSLKMASELDTIWSLQISARKVSCAA